MNTRIVCGHSYAVQEVNAFLQFQIINAVQQGYDDNGGKESGLSLDAWLNQGIKKFDKRVILPLLEVAFEPLNGAPPIGEVMTSRVFDVQDFKAVTEALKSFSSSVTSNFAPPIVMLETSGESGKPKAAPKKKGSTSKSTSRKSTAS